MSNSVKASWVKPKINRCCRHNTSYQTSNKTSPNSKRAGHQAPQQKKKTISDVHLRAKSASASSYRAQESQNDVHNRGNEISRQPKQESILRPKSALHPPRYHSAGGPQRRARFADIPPDDSKTNDSTGPTTISRSLTESEQDDWSPSWSMTQLPDDGQILMVIDDDYEQEDDEQELKDDYEEIDAEINESELAISSQEAWTAASSSSEDITSVSDERPRVDYIASMMEGPSATDADFDTDVEEDFPPGPEVTYDSTGRNVYIHECLQEGVDPARYVLRHLHESSFKLRHRYLNMQNIIPLAKAMKTNTCIESLDLSDNHLESKAATAIADMMIDNCYVTKLDLSENLVKSDGILAFSKMLETNYTLKCLCLRGNQLTDKDALVLSEALKNNATLTELDLSQNKLGELAGVHLGSGLGSNDGLSKLDLKWNAIRGKGILSIANALKANSALEVLDMSWNGVTQQGCIALMKMLKLNTGLKILDLSHNHVNTIGLQKISLGIKKNESIEALLLNSNPIGDDGVLALLKNIPYCPTLRLVALQDIALSMAVHQRVGEIQTLRDICILTRDIDGHKRIFAPSHTVSMVDQFIAANQTRLIDQCFSMDETRSGIITAKQLQKALLKIGLDLSEEQVQSALKDVNILYSKSIPYRLLLDGLSALTVT